MDINNFTIQKLISAYERDIYGNQYTYKLSDGETVSFRIEKEDVPHLMGIRKLPLRQVQKKSATAVYEMLKKGIIDISHVSPHKESFKKVVNFHHIISILYCGDTVKVVKRVGRLKSSYLFFLDHSPHEIIHLGIVKDPHGVWHPESLLIIQRRHVDAYIKNQLPLIIDMEIS